MNNTHVENEPGNSVVEAARIGQQRGNIKRLVFNQNSDLSTQFMDFTNEMMMVKLPKLNICYSNKSPKPTNMGSLLPTNMMLIFLFSFKR